MKPSPIYLATPGREMMAGKDRITVNNAQHTREMTSALPANARFCGLSMRVWTTPMTESTIIRITKKGCSVCGMMCASPAHRKYSRAIHRAGMARFLSRGTPFVKRITKKAAPSIWMVDIPKIGVMDRPRIR